MNLCIAPNDISFTHILLVHITNVHFSFMMICVFLCDIIYIAYVETEMWLFCYNARTGDCCAITFVTSVTSYLMIVDLFFSYMGPIFNGHSQIERQKHRLCEYLLKRKNKHCWLKVFFEQLCFKSNNLVVSWYAECACIQTHIPVSICSPNPHHPHLRICRLLLGKHTPA